MAPKFECVCSEHNFILNLIIYYTVIPYNINIKSINAAVVILYFSTANNIRRLCLSGHLSCGSNGLDRNRDCCDITFHFSFIKMQG